MKTLAIHSYKGGTGKTFLAINLAAQLVELGKETVLLELDFDAPSLKTTLGIEAEKWTNDVLIRGVNIEEALVSINNFKVALSNPSIEEINKVASLRKTEYMRVLGRLLRALKKLEREGIDYVIIDTSPGVSLMTINSIAASDVVLLVMREDDIDISGTKNMIEGIYDVLGKEVYIVLNRVLRKENKEKIERELNIEVISEIRCSCDVPLWKGKIFSIENRDHPVSVGIRELSEKLISLG
ncbi:hypothetical protein DRN46_00065 [Thermococci archaeon]|nr:MAG: hypothetical protein DRN46_00065 [Thermococci archaeon]